MRVGQAGRGRARGGERVQEKGSGGWREANRRRQLQTATQRGVMPALPASPGSKAHLLSLHCMQRTCIAPPRKRWKNYAALVPLRRRWLMTPVGGWMTSVDGRRLIVNRWSWATSVVCEQEAPRPPPCATMASREHDDTGFR